MFLSMLYTTNVKICSMWASRGKWRERFGRQKKSKCKSIASQVVKRAISWLTRCMKVPLYREKVQSINWLFFDRQSVSVSPLAVNPVVWLEWVDLDEVCLTHFGTYQPKNNLSSV